MGFFKNLFGTSEPKTEADQKNDTEKMFNIFHDDGVRAKNMGELKFAEQCFTKALEIRDDAPTRSYLVEVLILLQQYDEAVPQLQHLLDAAPDNLEVALLLASTYGRTKNYESEQALTDKIREQHPSEPRALYFAGEAAHGLGQDFQAIAFLTQALQQEEHYPAALLLRAQILASMGQYNEVLADAEALLALDNENEEYLLLHADALQGTGRDTEAEEAYLKVREMNPFSMEAMEKLGAFYALHHQLDKALVLYDEAIELQPENAVAYKLRGAVKLQLNDKLGAEDDLKKSLELQPESAKELDGEYSNIENKMEQRYRAQNPFQF